MKKITYVLMLISTLFIQVCAQSDDGHSKLGYNFVNDLNVEVCVVHDRPNQKVIATLDGRDVTEILRPPLINKDTINGIYVTKNKYDDKYQIILYLLNTDASKEFIENGYTVGVFINGQIRHIIFVDILRETKYFSLGPYSEKDLIQLLGKDKFKLIIK